MTDMIGQNTHLRHALFDRRGELQEDVQRRIRDRRTERPNDVHDESERTDGDLSNEMEFVLIGMKADMMSRIDAALSRLEAGDYGCCIVCGVRILETRLRALPFAVRCKACEETREQGQARTRRLAQQHANVSLFSEMVGS